MSNFHGEYAGSITGTAASLTLYDESKTAITLGSRQTLLVTDVQIVLGSVAPSGVVELFSDGYAVGSAIGTVDAGERIAGGLFAANSGINIQFKTPHQCPIAMGLKVKSSATETLTNCRVIVHGQILDA